jgi:hypothetical protein
LKWFPCAWAKSALAATSAATQAQLFNFDEVMTVSFCGYRRHPTELGAGLGFCGTQAMKHARASDEFVMSDGGNCQANVKTMSHISARSSVAKGQRSA